MDVVRVAVETETRAPAGRTNAYVIGRDPALLVDPADRTPELDDLVESRGVASVVVTHTHPDHVGAVATYVERYGLVPLALSGHESRFEAATGVRPSETVGDGDRLTVGVENRPTVTEDDGSTAGDDRLPADQMPVEPLPAGQKPVDQIRILALPGHAADHVGIVAGTNGPVCCGDLAVRDGSVAVAGPDADMGAYLDSLGRLAALDPSALLPGHGPPIEEPAATLDRLRRHRIRRERRILESVESGASTVEEIVERSYEKELGSLADLAAATVVAHLEALEADGEIHWDGEHASVR